MDYFPPKNGQAKWGRGSSHKSFRLGHCTVGAGNCPCCGHRIDGEFWWLSINETSAGFEAVAWQCKPNPCNFRRKKGFNTEEEAVEWVETRVGLRDQSKICTENSSRLALQPNRL